MNKHAQALGRLARGKSKRFRPEDIKRLTAQLAEARKLRWKR